MVIAIDDLDRGEEGNGALRIVDQHSAPVLDPTGGYLWPPEPPPDAETLLDLLHRELGAYLIDA